MLFSSLVFLVKFLPIFFFLYYCTPKRYRNITLVLGSFFFYGWGNLQNLILLAAMMIVNYFFGRGLQIERTYIKQESRLTKRFQLRRKALFFVSICLNISVLLLFKLMFRQNMPLGLSFYTFQVVAYLTDVYRREIPAETSFFRYMAYTSLFSTLASGPIVYYSELAETLKNPFIPIALIDEGMKQFVVGLAMKVLLADKIGILWNDIQIKGFASISLPLAWLGAYAYSIYIYFDFFGYTLMAVGLGKMLGFHLPGNFNHPYSAKSIRDFYRRWHMTLGRWFCKYMYIPLGGSRVGKGRTLLNLLAVWLVTSLWHGISLNYFLWGLLLWFFISMEKWIGFGERTGNPWSRALSHCYVLIVIPVSWILFAVPDMGELQTYLGRMTGMVPGINVNPLDVVRLGQDYGIFLIAGIFACLPVTWKWYEVYKNKLIGMIVLALLFWYSLWRILLQGNNPFLYLNF